MRKHIFNAGPCLLPKEALDNAIEALKDFKGTGVPVVSMSHRSREWVETMDETRALWRELLCIPDEYEVLFIAGGASMQFLMVPENYLNIKAAYLDTGVWASKAMKEAAGFGETVVVASSKDADYSFIPKDFPIPDDADYLHITTNNTIYGTELLKDIDSPVPLIADMSSDILSRPIDVTKYALIYGGAQKNAGTAGVGFVIVRKDSLGKVDRYIPTLLDYRTHIRHESMFNTPPVFSILVMNETLKWLKAKGGVAAIEKENMEKSRLLYAELDRNPLFRGTAAVEDRSRMNVTFVMSEGNEALSDSFLSYAEARGIVGIKGHRLVGGFRASIYNACTLEDVQALVDCMGEFEKECAFVSHIQKKLAKL